MTPLSLLQGFTDGNTTFFLQIRFSVLVRPSSAPVTHVRYWRENGYATMVHMVTHKVLLLLARRVRAPTRS
jgi:hypothetical protein